MESSRHLIAAWIVVCALSGVAATAAAQSSATYVTLAAGQAVQQDSPDETYDHWGLTARAGIGRILTRRVAAQAEFSLSSFDAPLAFDCGFPPCPRYGDVRTQSYTVAIVVSSDPDAPAPYALAGVGARRFVDHPFVAGTTYLVLQAGLGVVFVQRGRFQMMLDVRYERVPTIPGGPAWQLPVTLALRL